eukprot:tig00001532_g9273.t1
MPLWTWLRRARSSSPLLGGAPTAKRSDFLCLVARAFLPAAALVVLGLIAYLVTRRTRAAVEQQQLVPGSGHELYDGAVWALGVAADSASWFLTIYASTLSAAVDWRKVQKATYIRGTALNVAVSLLLRPALLQLLVAYFVKPRIGVPEDEARAAWLLVRPAHAPAVFLWQASLRPARRLRPGSDANLDRAQVLARSDALFSVLQLAAVAGAWALYAALAGEPHGLGLAADLAPLAPLCCAIAARHIILRRLAPAWLHRALIPRLRPLAVASLVLGVARLLLASGPALAGEPRAAAVWAAALALHAASAAALAYAAARLLNLPHDACAPGALLAAAHAARPGPAPLPALAASALQARPRARPRAGAGRPRAICVHAQAPGKEAAGSGREEAVQVISVPELLALAARRRSAPEPRPAPPAPPPPAPASAGKPEAAGRPRPPGAPVSQARSAGALPAAVASLSFPSPFFKAVPLKAKVAQD